MDSNYLNSMHGNFPPFNLDFSPSFLHSKKLNVQPLILWENILRGCLACKKIENRREKINKRDLCITKLHKLVSWRKLPERSIFSDYKRIYIGRQFYPFLDTSYLRNYMVVEYKEKMEIWTQKYQKKKSRQKYPNFARWSSNFAR